MEHEHDHPRPQQEEDTLPPRLILYAILGSLAFSLVLGVASWSLQKTREHDLRPSDDYPEARLGPIMERSNVHEELYSQLGRGQVFEKTGRQALHSFQWVDDQKKVIRVPIDMAIDLYVEQANKPSP